MSTGGQSRLSSFQEAWVNFFIGYAVNFVANLLVLPLFGYNVTIRDNLIIGVIYTAISLARSYAIRRWFNTLLVKPLPMNLEYRQVVEDMRPTEPEHMEPPFLVNPGGKPARTIQRPTTGRE